MGKVAPTDCAESTASSTSPGGSLVETSSSDGSSGPTAKPSVPSTRSPTSKPAPTASTSCPSPPVDQDGPTTQDAGGLNLAWVLALGGLVLVVVLVAVLAALSARARRHEGSAAPSRPQSPSPQPSLQPPPSTPPPTAPSTPPSTTVAPVLDHGAIDELVRAWDRTTDPSQAAMIEADLGRLGVTRVSARPGEALNPSLHRVVDVTDEPGVTPGTLTDEVRPGWTTGTEVIRPADVRVRGAGP